MKEAEAAKDRSRTMYSLVEAAALSGRSVDDLLQHGARRQLPILARVPENVLVYCTNLDLLDLAGPDSGGPMGQMKERYLEDVRPVARQDISLLVLRPGDCGLVASHGEAHQSVFLTGVAFNGASDPVLVEPAALVAPDGYHDLRPFRRFACYSIGHDPSVPGVPKRTPPTRIKLTTDVLRVRCDDLASLDILRVADGRSRKFDNGFRVERYMPKQLIQLNEGAWRFWDCSQPGWSEPSNKEVKDWLMNECGFPSKVAASAAQILRQSYKNWDQEKYDQRRTEAKASDKGRVPVLANMFDAVVFAAELWKNADLGGEGREGRRETYPNEENVLSMLTEEYGWADHVASAVWRIAQPKPIKANGRPTNYR